MADCCRRDSIDVAGEGITRESAGAGPIRLNADSTNVLAERRDEIPDRFLRGISEEKLAERLEEDNYITHLGQFDIVTGRSMAT